MIRVVTNDTHKVIRFQIGTREDSIGSAHFVDGLDLENGLIFLSGFNDEAALWMRTWAGSPRDDRTLVIWDHRLQRAFVLEGTTIQRSTTDASQLKRDTYTLLVSRIREGIRPRWLQTVVV